MRGIFAKYVTLIAGLVAAALLAAGALGFWFLAGVNAQQLEALQQEKASAAALRIALFVQDVEHQLALASAPGMSRLASGQRRLEFLKLLHQVPALAELAWIDSSGHEQLRSSRMGLDQEHAGTDYRSAPFMRETTAGRTFYGPVEFRKGSEPHLMMAVPAGAADDGTVLADVNLTFVGEVVAEVRVGRSGRAFVLDRDRNLIAHPDLNRVLSRTSLSTLEAEGGDVLSASAPVPGPGWRVVTELPRAEALAPLRALFWRGLVVLLAALAAAVLASVLLARRMVTPIRALQAGAADVAAGRLDQQIEVRTGDELEGLAREFNAMTARLRESYATLDLKVRERTRALATRNEELAATLESLARARQGAEAASNAKSRFLAAASHDLRQPMHALNLYLGAMATHELPERSRELLAKVRQCAQTMDSLFEGLLDISRLDAKAVQVRAEVFAIAPLLQCIANEFEPQAREQGLRLHVVPSRALVRTDPALLGRIVRNLVSNALRYTPSGRVLVGCRHAAGALRIQVHDTGIGIAPEFQQLVFEEFFQVGNAERDRGQGLGLGLSIVQRISALLDAQLRLVSRPGHGSMFELRVPLAPQMQSRHQELPQHDAGGESLRQSLVVVVEDDKAVLDATQLLLEQWGCEVVPAGSGVEALRTLAGISRAPDLLVCDYRLRPPENGLEVIELLREEFNRDIPAVLVTGDALPRAEQPRDEARLAVLHKPLQDRLLQGALVRLLRVSREGSSTHATAP
jgi:signal transduction histidine kinase